MEYSAIKRLAKDWLERNHEEYDEFVRDINDDFEGNMSIIFLGASIVFPQFAKDFRRLTSNDILPTAEMLHSIGINLDQTKLAQGFSEMSAIDPETFAKSLEIIKNNPGKFGFDKPAKEVLVQYGFEPSMTETFGKDMSAIDILSQVGLNFFGNNEPKKTDAQQQSAVIDFRKFITDLFGIEQPESAQLDYTLYNTIELADIIDDLREMVLPYCVWFYLGRGFETMTTQLLNMAKGQNPTIQDIVLLTVERIVMTSLIIEARTKTQWEEYVAKRALFDEKSTAVKVLRHILSKPVPVNVQADRQISYDSFRGLLNTKSDTLINNIRGYLERGGDGYRIANLYYALLRGKHISPSIPKKFFYELLVKEFGDEGIIKISVFYSSLKVLSDAYQGTALSGTLASAEDKIDITLSQLNENL